MRTVRLVAELPGEAAEALAGTLLGENAFDVLVDGDADVFKPDGTPLLHYRAGVVPADVCAAAYEVFRHPNVVVGSANRGVATGRGKKVYRVKGDGTTSRSHATLKPVPSGIVGYFDRNARYPYCRMTAFGLEFPGLFARAMPYVRAAHGVFERVCPARHAAQHAFAARTTPEFVLKGTCFTTVTVNRNWQTAVHTDKGDLAEGFGVMTALRGGEFSGCYLCFPKYRVAVDMRTGGVLLADVHEWHGSTPFHGKAGTYLRLSTVMYYRRNMIHCGTPAQEEERAKNRRRGTPLNG
jgi:hypothetical protein